MTPYAAWLRRLAAYLDGQRWPDPRDQELRDRGVELHYRARVRHRERGRRMRCEALEPLPIDRRRSV